MSIDWRIPLLAQGPQIQQVDPMDRFGKILGIQNALGAGDLQQLQLQSAQQGAADDQAVRSSFTESQGDNARLRALLSERGQYKALQHLDRVDLERREKEATIGKNTAQGDKANYDVELDKIARVSSVLNIADEQNWPSVRRMLVMQHPKAADDFPENFDPQFIKMMTAQGQTLTQQLQDQRAREQSAQRAANDPFTAGPTGPVPNTQVQQFQLQKATASAPSVNVSNGPIMPGKTAMNKVDEGLLDTTGRRLRLNQIEAGYRPEFQQFAPRLSNMWSAVKEKAGANLSQPDRQGLESFSKFKRSAIDNLNQYIKEITGAAMTNAEAERILRGMPNPGAGVFDGDSPTEFKAKLSDIIRQTRMAEARLVYIKRNGMSLSDANGNPSVPLEQMPSLMNERGRQLEQSAQKNYPNASPLDVNKMVKRDLAEEFGLVYE